MKITCKRCYLLDSRCIECNFWHNTAKSWQKIQPGVVSGNIMPKPFEDRCLPLVRQIAGYKATEEQEIVE